MVLQVNWGHQGQLESLWCTARLSVAAGSTNGGESANLLMDPLLGEPHSAKAKTVFHDVHGELAGFLSHVSGEQSKGDLWGVFYRRHGPESVSSGRRCRDEEVGELDLLARGISMGALLTAAQNVHIQIGDEDL